MNLGAAITLARKNLKWSKRDLAIRASLSPSTITRIENGDQGIPLRTAKAIAEALGLKLWQLMIVAESVDEPLNEIKSLQQKLVLASQPYFAFVQKELLHESK